MCLCVCCVIYWIFFCVCIIIKSTHKMIQTLRADVYEFKKPKSLRAVYRFHCVLVRNQKFIIWLDFNFKCRWNDFLFLCLSRHWYFSVICFESSNRKSISNIIVAVTRENVNVTGFTILSTYWGKGAQKKQFKSIRRFFLHTFDFMPLF